jgi:hypothetical protein
MTKVLVATSFPSRAIAKQSSALRITHSLSELRQRTPTRTPHSHSLSIPLHTCYATSAFTLPPHRLAYITQTSLPAQPICDAGTPCIGYTSP